jgi:NTE family protein
MTARQPRRALVLGGGGVLGFAWTLGALSAVEAVTGVRADAFDLVVGTSAGAVAAGLLGCGLDVDALCRHHQGAPTPDDLPIDYDYDGTGGALPERPRMRPASAHLLINGIRHPRLSSPLIAVSGLLPLGTGTLAAVHDLLGDVAAASGHERRWPAAPRPWIVAVDYDAGRRVVFGRDELATRRDGSARMVRAATLNDAVTASCSIPGWYEPTVIDGVRYVDGGVASNASTDVLLSTDVDEVFVLAPMGGDGRAHPRTLVERLEALVRRRISKTIGRDVAALRARGVLVRVLVPQAEDLGVMGMNLMDPAPRRHVLEAARDTAAEQLRRQLAVSSLPWARAARSDRRSGGDT